MFSAGTKEPRNGLRIIRSPSGSQASPSNAFNFATQYSYPGTPNTPHYKQQQPNFITAQEIEENSSANQVKEDVWSPARADPAKIMRSPGADARKAAYEQREITLDQVPESAMHRMPTNSRQDIPVWDRFKYYERCAVTDF